MKIKKKIPLIDQHDKNFMYGGKFGGNFIPETLKKPIDDLTKLFQIGWAISLISLSDLSSNFIKLYEAFFSFFSSTI